MKKSVILDIFHGFRGSLETMKMPTEHFEHGKEVCRVQDELKEKLSPELYALHEKFVKLFSNNYSDEIDFYFIEGFKLGLQIGIEGFKE